MEIEIWTDGACINPGPGGWGVLLRAIRDGGEVIDKELCGFEPETTNNRMEIQAVIEGLRALKIPTSCTVYSDSQYVIFGMTRWLAGWQKKNWNKVANADLWKALVAEASLHKVKWEWVRAHVGIEGNERADRLACSAIEANVPSEKRLG